MTIQEIDEGALKIIDTGGVYLGFPTGVGNRRFSGTDTVAFKKDPGILVDEAGRIRPWPVERFVEHQGNMVALGPWVEDTRPFASLKPDPHTLVRLIPALNGIGASGYGLNGLYSPAVRWLGGGGVLVFPPKLAEWVKEFRPPEPWVHPDLKGEPAWSFSLGVLAWMSLTGEDPYKNESGEARRERMRLAVLPSLHAVVPDLDDNVQQIITRSLTGSGQGRPDIVEWEKLLRRWCANGVKRDMTLQEFSEAREKAQRQSRSSEGRLNARRWFRKSGWKLLAGAAAGALLIAFVSAPLKKALETPVTAGMSAVQVAEVYYEAVSSLDSETLEVCLARKADRRDARMVEMLYVTSKMRQGYEGIGAPPPAEQWIREGKPELPYGVYPLGASGLELKDLGQGRVEARYLFWGPPDGETGLEGTREPVPRIDVLTFVQGRKSLEIVQIDRRIPDSP
jgi:hypothetical protein